MEIPIREMASEERKEYIDAKVQKNADWITTLTKKVNEGIITGENANKMIARAMTAREIKTELAEDKAKRDPLTELYNKRVFKDEYDKLIKKGSPFALLIIDIDDFKKINENKNLGYLVGDSVLVQTALNLSTNLRQLRGNDKENDFICRWGGEEFAVLLKDVTEKENLQKISEKLRKVTCERPFSVNTTNGIQDVPITVSIGGGIYRGEDKGVFFDKVDKLGVKEAKNTGKNKVVVI